ncbi:TIR-like protein FxsC [Streptomyces sp. NBC_01465]|uniref:TIR-like protein FxsC n=1 Tax=Streptomyces sp. NBC_01465 TaxID=2903878 RepID=UPI002E37B8D6|nr:TIR-like protein FxsC [Streptomyces sp. NBC_01465]
MADHRPYFYLSYAHTPRGGAGAMDPDMWVERLYGDLCAHVLAMTNLPAGAPAGFMDRQLRAGEDWSEQLGEVLATCRVFVPLFSPRYFDSELCGKEWHAFEQRAIRHRATTAGPAEAIVPALWVPVPSHLLPTPAERLQFNHRDFGDRYVSDGLYGLIKLRAFAEEYERAVYELAKRIVSVAEDTEIAPGRALDYRKAPSAFGRGMSPRAMHVTVAAPTVDDLPEGRDSSYYGHSSLDWNPYYPSTARPLAFVAQDIGHSLNYQVTVSSLDEEAPYEGGKQQGPTRPGVLLVDRWALQDPARRARVADFGVHRPWVSVVVPRNPHDLQSAAVEESLSRQLAVALPSTLQVRPGAEQAAVEGVSSLEDFAQVLPQIAEAAAQQYLRTAPVYPPLSARIAERPRLNGPLGRWSAPVALPFEAGPAALAAAASLGGQSREEPEEVSAARVRAHVMLVDDDPRTGTPVRLAVELVAEPAHLWVRPDVRPVLDVVAVPLSRADVAPATASYGPGAAELAQFALLAKEPGRHRIRFTFVHHDTGVVLQQVETYVDVAGSEGTRAGRGRS